MGKIIFSTAIFIMSPVLSHSALNYSFLLSIRSGYQDTDFLQYFNEFMEEGWILSGNFIGNFQLETESITWALEIDTREISKITLKEENGESYFVDYRVKKSYLLNELYLDIHPVEWVDIYLGKKEFEEMFGFISNTYLMGGSVFFDLYKSNISPFVFSAGIYKVEKSEEFFNPDFFDPIVRVSVDYRISLFEFVSFSFMLLHEENNLFGTLMNIGLQQLFQPIIQNMISREESPIKKLYLQSVLLNLLERPFRSSKGYFLWLNFYGKKYLWNFLIIAGISLETGNTDLTYKDVFTEKEIPLSVVPLSYAGFLKLEYKKWDRMQPFLHFIYMSGDETPLNLADGYNNFISPYQYITDTSLFYQGGINAHFSTGSFVPAGLIGYGNISFIIGLDLNLLFDISIVQAFLFSAVSPKPIQTESEEIKAGMIYGYETDLILVKEVSSSLSFLMEFDIFTTGNFFRNQETIFRFITGIDLMF